MLKLIILSFLTTHLQAKAQNSPSSARLVSPLQRVLPDSRVDIGVHITLQKGWHTYWQNPGDIGKSLQWTHPPSLSMSSMIWPLPQRRQTQKWNHFIYENEALIKRSLYIPKNAQDKFSVSSKIRWLICKIICKPVSRDVHLDFSIGQPLNSPAGRKIFQKFIYPNPSNLSGAIERKKEKDVIRIQSSENFELIDFFPIQSLSHTAPKTEQISSSSYEVSLPKSKSLKDTKALIVFKRNKKTQADEISFSNQSRPLIFILIMAFIGGLILNLMPCVLPVVFLKFYHTASIPRGKLIGSSLSYGAGIIFSFLVLAFFIQFLKTGGQAVGWGFQMESPFFVSFLILLFALISFSFLDLFSIPVFFQKSKTQDTLAGSFLSGLLITAAASPCTAPFMGTAIGYAFSRSTVEVLFVFSSLGFGTAFPYFLLCSFPKLLKYFPHPGSWNQKLKKAMSIPMLSTLVWLFSILSHLTASHLMVSLGAGLLMTALALWLKKNQYIKKGIFIGLICLSALLILYVHTSFYAEKLKHTPSQAKNVFSMDRLHQIREKSGVLLYFTAPWCLSCQVNEWTTLKDQGVLRFLHQNNIVLMKVNWNPENTDIEKIFKRHKRAGIPFTLFFPSGEKPEIILPEILAPKILMNILKNNK